MVDHGGNIGATAIYEVGIDTTAPTWLTLISPVSEYNDVNSDNKLSVVGFADPNLFVNAILYPNVTLATGSTVSGAGTSMSGKVSVSENNGITTFFKFIFCKLKSLKLYSNNAIIFRNCLCSALFLFKGFQQFGKC